MSGYLEKYGVGDDKRERRTKRIVLGLLLAVVVAGALFLALRNLREKRVAGNFLDTLRAKDYQTAYRMWGCTEQTPCRDYSFQRFMADWGPQGTYADPSKISYGEVDSCGGGVVFTIQYPGADAAGLYVDRSTKIVSFAPWPRCPGRHWNFKAFWQSWFGKPEAPPPPQ